MPLIPNEERFAGTWTCEITQAALGEYNGKPHLDIELSMKCLARAGRTAEENKLYNVESHGFTCRHRFFLMAKKGGLNPVALAQISAVCGWTKSDGFGTVEEMLEGQSCQARVVVDGDYANVASVRSADVDPFAPWTSGGAIERLASDKARSVVSSLDRMLAVSADAAEEQFDAGPDDSDSHEDLPI